jgi:tRNA (cytidine/uridine-2'-O-)-methyltransferase
MDYRERAVIRVHPNLASWLEQHRGKTLAFSNKGTSLYTEVAYEPADALLFGPESVGLPVEVMEAEFIAEVVRIPMQPEVRSLNLANACAIGVYEAWRQHSFA